MEEKKKEENIQKIYGVDDPRLEERINKVKETPTFAIIERSTQNRINKRKQFIENYINSKRQKKAEYMKGVLNKNTNLEETIIINLFMLLLMQDTTRLQIIKNLTDYTDIIIDTEKISTNISMDFQEIKNAANTIKTKMRVMLDNQLQSDEIIIEINNEIHKFMSEVLKYCGNNIQTKIIIPYFTSNIQPNTIYGWIKRKIELLIDDQKKFLIQNESIDLTTKIKKYVMFTRDEIIKEKENLIELAKIEIDENQNENMRMTIEKEKSLQLKKIATVLADNDRLMEEIKKDIQNIQDEEEIEDKDNKIVKAVEKRVNANIGADIVMKKKEEELQKAIKRKSELEKEYDILKNKDPKPIFGTTKQAVIDQREKERIDDNAKNRLREVIEKEKMEKELQIDKLEGEIINKVVDNKIEKLDIEAKINKDIKYRKKPKQNEIGAIFNITKDNKKKKEAEKILDKEEIKEIEIKRRESSKPKTENTEYVKDRPIDPNLQIQINLPKEDKKIFNEPLRINKKSDLHRYMSLVEKEPERKLKKSLLENKDIFKEEQEEMIEENKGLEGRRYAKAWKEDIGKEETKPITTKKRYMDEEIEEQEPKKKESPLIEDNTKLTNIAIDGSIRDYIIQVDNFDKLNYTEMGIYFKNQMNQILNKLFEASNTQWTISINAHVWAENAKRGQKSNGFITVIQIPSSYKCSDRSMGTNTVNKMWLQILEYIDEYLFDKSTLVVTTILQFTVNCIREMWGYAGTYTPTPEIMRQKKAIANPKNKDEYCILYCILIHRLHKDQSSTLFKSWREETFDKDFEKIDSNLTYLSQLRYRNIEMPITMSNISRLEQLNKIHINVFGYEIYQEKKTKEYGARGPKSTKQKSFQIIPIYSSFKGDSVKYEDSMNILRIESSTKDTHHFAYIHNINSLLRESSSPEATICPRCLTISPNKKEHDEIHWPICLNYSNLRYTLPTQINEEKPCIQFKNFTNKIPVPFVIYSDFESIIRQKNLLKNTEVIKCTEHIPCGFFYRTVFQCHKSGIRAPDHFTTIYERSGMGFGEKVENQFIEAIKTECARITKIVTQTYKPLIMDNETWKMFQIASKCYLCEKPFEFNNKSGDKKVRDHCHLTGYYRGACHSSCNIAASYERFIPVIFHNLSGYDMHLFVKDLFDGSINIIAKSTEKYISLEIEPNYYIKTKNTEVESQYPQLIEKSTWQNMEKQEQSNYTKLFKIKFIDSMSFLNSSLDKLVKNLGKNHVWNFCGNELLQQKGFYPYEFMDSLSKFEYTSLPSIENFYSTLMDSTITNDEWQHAKKIWDIFECKSMKDYHNIYLQTDVLLLAEVFENFRYNCLLEYGLDPCHYITTPGLAWDACLKQTQIKLELLTDMTMYNFIENGIRGGVASCGEYRHIELNNNSNSEIKYYDINNLYGFAMCENLPYKDFEWIENPYEYYQNVGLEYMAKSKYKGYILEVDLEYPEYLHDEHNSYPLAPEHTNGKLMLTLYNKSNYIVHSDVLLTYLEYGLKITYVHRILRFAHKNWMNNYIMSNHNKRLLCKEKGNTAMADFYKLMNNSVYGKTMENVKKRKNYKIVRSSHDLNVNSRQFEYKRHKTYSENFVVIAYQSTNIVLNKPIYLGFTILEYAKKQMYRYYYGVFKNLFKDEVCMLYTDTDSMILRMIKGPNYEKNIPKLQHYVSDRLIGMIKDEYEDEEIEAYIGLRAKSYCVKSTKKEKIVNKGIPARCNQRNLSYSKFVEIMHSNESMVVKFNKICSYNHNLYNMMVEKVAISSEDTKRYVKEKENKTYALGHKDII
jgi:hypothetical protein